MAVAAAVFDDAAPPPDLLRALNYERWGIGDVRELRAGLLQRLNAALNVYHACQNYVGAAGNANAAKWTQANPKAWNMISWIIAERKRGGNK